MNTSTSDGFQHPLGNGTLTEELDSTDGYYVALNHEEVNEDLPNGPANHLGEDWNANSGGDTDQGDIVHSISNGVVTQIGFLAGSSGSIDSGLGNYLVIRHDLPEERLIAGVQTDHVTSLYAHLEPHTLGVEQGTVDELEVGDIVERGQPIGLLGDSGFASRPGTSAHLHFEIRLGERFTDSTGYQTPPHEEGWVDPTEFIEGNRSFGNLPPEITAFDQTVKATADNLIEKDKWFEAADPNPGEDVTWWALLDANADENSGSILTPSANAFHDDGLQEAGVWIIVSDEELSNTFFSGAGRAAVDRVYVAGWDGTQWSDPASFEVTSML